MNTYHFPPNSQISDQQIKISTLPKGFYWLLMNNNEPIIFEKRDEENFVRFTNGTKNDFLNGPYSKVGCTVVGPIDPPKSESLKKDDIINAVDELFQKLKVHEQQIAHVQNEINRFKVALLYPFPKPYLSDLSPTF